MSRYIFELVNCRIIPSDKMTKRKHDEIVERSKVGEFFKCVLDPELFSVSESKDILEESRLLDREV